jgi:hypothetical protein
MENHTTKIVGNKTMATLVADLRAAHGENNDGPPAGAFTVRQYAEANGITVSAAAGAVNRLIRTGSAVRLGSFRVNLTNCARMTAYFQLTKKK